MNLSKSKYTRGVQCPKMLWMEEHLSQWYDSSVMNQTVLDNGNAMGDLAMGYFGSFVEVPFDPQDPQRFAKAKERTQQLLAAGEPTICEATFDFDGNYCMADILRRREDGAFDLVEVKSSTHCKEVYLHDMAYQTWVLQQCGLDVRTTSLLYVNKQYVRQGQLDLQGLFKLEDHTDDVAEMIPAIAARTLALKATAEQPSEPQQPLGEQCFSPYECGFRPWCWREMPTPNVFDIGRVHKKKAAELHQRGIDSFQQVMDAPDVWGMLTNKQRQQVEGVARQLPPVIDRAAISSFLDTLRFPLYFLDFETFQPAVPLYDGTRPFQQIPCQYSLHVLQAPDAPLEHYEFLAPAGADPRRAIAESLVAAIPANVCTLAYNMSFERGRISELADLFPDLAEHLMTIGANMRDLAVPFQRGDYYDAAMGGSYSIKHVLPALFPNDPDLDYHNLEGVHNGGEAMAAYGDLVNMTPEDAARTRQQLLRYCELDTLAMVKIWQRLVEVAQ